MGLDGARERDKQKGGAEAYSLGATALAVQHVVVEVDGTAVWCLLVHHQCAVTVEARDLFERCWLPTMSSPLFEMIRS